MENDAALPVCGNGLLVNGTGAVLDLNGHSLSVGTVGLIDGQIVNSGSSGALSADTCIVLSGEISANLSGNGSLIKGTSGAVTLSGNNDYTGLTTVYAGELDLDGPDAWNPILNSGGTDINGGQLVFDYSSTGTSPVDTVRSNLSASYVAGDGSLTSGPMYTSTGSASGYGIGYNDNTEAQTVTAQIALCGDANLSGAREFCRPERRASPLHNQTGQTWATGDFNYDGAVDFADMNIVLANYNQQLPTGLPPQVVAIARLGSTATDSDTVQFAVVFSEDVSGVDTTNFTDFDLQYSGTSGSIASVDDCSPCHAVFLVTVDNVLGNGTLGLNLVDNDTIAAGGLPLVGSGTDDGSFSGQLYTMTGPFVWDGGSTVDSSWTTPENWVGDVLPTAGSSLRFLGATRTDTENDFTVGMSFDSVQFASAGFSVAGNGLTLTDGITVEAGVTDATISVDVALDGDVTIDVADTDASLSVSGDLSGSGSLTKTGDGTLAVTTDAHTGDTTVGAGTLLVGTLPSVFTDALDGGVTFSTERPDATLVADPGTSGGTFAPVSVAGLIDGSVSLTPDGILGWQPNFAIGCHPGTYAATATYTYNGGLQISAFTLNIADEDMPPAFTFTRTPADANWDGRDNVYANPILYATITPGVAVFYLPLPYAYDHEGDVTYDLVPGPNGMVPPHDPVSNGFIPCYFTLADNHIDYQFDVVATDSAGQIDKRHVVIGVNETYGGFSLVATNTYAAVAMDSTDNQISVVNDVLLMQLCNGQLVIDSGADTLHGSVGIDPNHFGCVLYTPAAGYRGLDSFSYHWEYDVHDYLGNTIGRAATDIATESIQVGNWVDLVPDTSYGGDVHQSILGVGDGETATLTLQNPRSNGVLGTGYWALYFDRSQIRVYGAAGNELLPGPSLLSVGGAHVPCRRRQRAADHADGGRCFGRLHHSHGQVVPVGLRP